MVRISLSFLSVAALAVASAAPFFGQQIFDSDVYEGHRCIPETLVKEYQAFELESFALKSLVSRELTSNLLVGGLRGNKNLQQLQFCIVSTDRECNPTFPTDCIRENVEYRFRVNGPMKGYLHIDGHVIRIVEDFHAASGLNLYKEAGWGLRISHFNRDGSRSVFATTRPGSPIILEHPEMNNRNQWFGLLPPYEMNEVESFGENQCVPETSIREYHPFQLKSSNLDTQVSKERDEDILVGGVNGNKNFQQLEMCIVSSDLGCSSTIKSACIYSNVEYKFRVNSPTKGYLRIEDNEVKIVKKFEDASDLNLYKEAGWGLRIAHVKKDGTRIVFAAKKQGKPITLEEPVTNAARQWFQIIEANEHWLW